jgi:hypothetical protein
LYSPTGLHKHNPNVIPPLFMTDIHAATQHFCWCWCITNVLGTWGHCPHDVPRRRLHIPARQWSARCHSPTLARRTPLDVTGLSEERLCSKGREVTHTASATLPPSEAWPPLVSQKKDSTRCYTTNWGKALLQGASYWHSHTAEPQLSTHTCGCCDFPFQPGSAPPPGSVGQPPAVLPTPCQSHHSCTTGSPKPLSLSSSHGPSGIPWKTQSP